MSVPTDRAAGFPAVDPASIDQTPRASFINPVPPQARARLKTDDLAKV